MADDPAFLFYPGDYLRDTQCLSEKSQVAYDRIMCEHMRNICISQQQLNFFTKRLSPEEIEELMMVLTKVGDGFQIKWVADSICKRMKYSESRRSNRKGKTNEHMNNISKSYDSHMENENENENSILKDRVVGKDVLLKIENPVAPVSEMTGPLALDEKTISGFLWMDQTYLESVLAWQHYKISRMEGFSYEHSLKSFLKRLKSISSGIPEKAKMIVEYSMGKQYKDVYVPSQEEQNMYFANGKDVSKVSHGGKNLGSLPEGWLKKAINNG